MYIHYIFTYIFIYILFSTCSKSYPDFLEFNSCKLCGNLKHSITQFIRIDRLLSNVYYLDGPKLNSSELAAMRSELPECLQSSKLHKFL